MASTTRQPQPVRRIWKVPKSTSKWYWLIVSLIMYGGIYAWYLSAIETQPYPGPYNDPLRFFGIVAFVLMLLVAAYSLRRRFMHRLPGNVQSWLWLHTWFGVLSILLSFLHENYQYVLHEYYFSKTFFTEADAGMPALIALFLLVISGIAGRSLDVWQAHVIATEANSNGVGIPQAVEERLHELELTIERLGAGKSVAFKNYCTRAYRDNAKLPGKLPVLALQEQDDFRRVYDVLLVRLRLLRSLNRQRRATLIMLAWRYVHIPLATLSLVIVGFHSVAELVNMVLPALRR